MRSDGAAARMLQWPCRFHSCRHYWLPIETEKAAPGPPAQGLASKTNSELRAPAGDSTEPAGSGAAQGCERKKPTAGFGEAAEDGRVADRSGSAAGSRPATPSATFHGRESYVVQELRIESENTCYLRARYNLPDGGTILAPFPPGVLPVEGGHFGASLVTYILNQCHQLHVTEPLLLEQLEEFGIDISAGQLHRILTENKEHFHREKAEVLAAGLEMSSYIGTDDTGARHRGQNGYCTVIGNDLFAYFDSSDRKSRLNFLEVLHGREPLYALNEIAVAYWERQELAAAVVE